MSAPRSRPRLGFLGPMAALLAIGALSVPALTSAQVGWHVETLPALAAGEEYNLWDVQAVSANEAWVAGSVDEREAALLKTLNGTTWSLVFRKGPSDDPWTSFRSFYHLSVVDGSTAWVAGGVSGSSGITAFTTDGGASWSRDSTPCRSDPGWPGIEIYRLKALDANNVWVCGWRVSLQAGQILHRPYSGDCASYYFSPWPWRLEKQYDGKNVAAIDAADALNAWAVGHTGILHTTDGGTTWTTEVPFDLNELAEVEVVNANVAWAATGNGRIYKTVDAGAHWGQQGSGTTVIRKISAVNANVAWAVGGYGPSVIIKTTDGGETWREQVSPVSDRPLYSVAAIDANNAWAVGPDFVLHVTDGGVHVPLSEPTIDYLSRSNGPAAGGTQLVVYGQDYLPGAEVYFGGIAGTDVWLSGESALYVTTPAHAAGTVDVVLVNPDGPTATLVNGFTFAGVAPGVTSVTPNVGPIAGGTFVTITGTGFEEGATVTFDGAAATDVAVASATSITATTPAHAAGAVTVTVTNPGAQSGSLAGAFTYVAPPAVTGILPASGPSTGGTAVTITGSGFTAGATVTIGGVAATGVSVVNTTSITAATAAHAPGLVDVVVTIPGGGAGTLTGGFRYFAMLPGHLVRDFDGDHVADAAVYRPATGTWFALQSSTNRTTYTSRGWGILVLGDVPVRGDFDGDGIADPTVYRPSTGTWFVLQSSGAYATWTWFGWGNATDTLVPGDYDGDGKADGAIFRPSTGAWWIRPSGGSPQWSVVFGDHAGDVPVPGNYDGDTKTDIAIYRPSTGSWFILTSSSGFTTWYLRGWGMDIHGDTPVPGDYDGDGKTDVAVYRPETGTWFILLSSTGDTGWTSDGWGAASDTPMPGDYDGDGKTDYAIYRPSNGEWWVKPSDGSTSWHVVFGQAGDVPLQKP